MSRLTRLPIILLVSAAATASAQETDNSRVDMFVRGARLFDGLEWRDNVSIIVDDGRIVEVSDSADAQQAAIELDARDWTVLPGLIDAHMHLIDGSVANPETPWAIEQLGELVKVGVTTIQSASDETEAVVSLRSRIASGEVFGPRLFVTGSQIAAAGGPRSFRCPEGTIRCTVSEVGNAADVEREVAEHARMGVDAIKFVSDSSFPRTLSQELIQATIETAHRHNLRVYGHVEHSADARVAIEAGLDALMHPVPWRTGAPGEVAELLAQRAIPVTTTLSLRAPYLGPDGTMKMFMGNPYPDNRFELLRHAVDVVNAMHAAGVPLAVGTDNNLMHQFQSAPEMYIRELQLLIEAGLSTTDALRAATTDAARHIGAAELGSVARDKVADFLIVSGDPRDNVLELRTVVIVVKDGRIVVDNR